MDPTLVPAALGAIAVWLLLPRPKTHSIWPGAVVGLAALVTGGFVLARDPSPAPTVERLLFYSFSGLALLGGGVLVTQRNPARGAIAFALVVLSTCGLFLLQAAPFVMAGTIIIYAGAIIVTFMFVIMLAQQRGSSDADNRSREPTLAVATGFVMLGLLFVVIRPHYDATELDQFRQRFGLLRGQGRLAEQMNELRSRLSPLAEHSTAVRQVSTALENLDNLLRDPNADPEAVRRQSDRVYDMALWARRWIGDMLPPDAARGISADQPAMPAGNVAAIGRSLFSDYLLAVELGGTLLLVATVGAIAIAKQGSGFRVQGSENPPRGRSVAPAP